MIKTFVLILSISKIYDGGAAIDHLEFEKHDECIAAGKAFVNANRDPIRSQFICVTKNTTKQK